MKILIKENLVDFEAPVYASEEQREKIVSFFKKNFEDVVTKDVAEPERQYSEKTPKKQHKWVAKDYLKLFSSKTNEELGDEFNLESGMGPQVKRGIFIMNFLEWRKKKGKKEPISEELIKEFLEEEA